MTLTVIKLVLAFKQELFREGLAKLLAEKTPHLTVLAKCSNGMACIQRTKELKPDIILLDTEITNCDCAEVTRSITSPMPETRIIILTFSGEESNLFATVKAGAKAYISKDTSVKDLVKDINHVYEGEVIISPPVAEKLLAEFRLLMEGKETRQEKDDHGQV